LKDLYDTLFFTGAAALAEKGKVFGFIDAIENAPVGLALVYGSGASLLVALFFSVLKPHANKETLRAVLKGALTMKEAMIILTAAWLVGAIIKDLQTGSYIASW